MKKKIVLVLALLFGLSNFLNAYTRILHVDYLGTTAEISLYYVYNNYVTRVNEEMKKQGNPLRETTVSKITKEESRLLWQGLNRYDYKAGEIYRVTIISSDHPMLTFFAEIKKDGSCS